MNKDKSIKFFVYFIIVFLLASPIFLVPTPTISKQSITPLVSDGDYYILSYIYPQPNGSVLVSNYTYLYQRDYLYNGNLAIREDYQVVGNGSSPVSFYYRYNILNQSTGKYIAFHTKYFLNSSSVVRNTTKVIKYDVHVSDLPFASLIGNNVSFNTTNTIYTIYDYVKSPNPPSLTMINHTLHRTTTWVADVSEEVLTTPAGSFVAWKVNHTGVGVFGNGTSWYADGTSWFASEEVEVAPITYISTYWISKEFNIILKSCSNVCFSGFNEIVEFNFADTTTSTTTITTTSTSTSTQTTTSATAIQTTTSSSTSIATSTGISEPTSTSESEPLNTNTDISQEVITTEVEIIDFSTTPVTDSNFTFSLFSLVIISVVTVIFKRKRGK